jgi:hypothetical protein
MELLAVFVTYTLNAAVFAAFRWPSPGAELVIQDFVCAVLLLRFLPDH